MMGVEPARAAVELVDAGADAVGSNCGNGIENMIAIAREFSRCTELPLVIQANAGLPETSGGATGGRAPRFPRRRAARLVANNGFRAFTNDDETQALAEIFNASADKFRK